MNWVNLTNDQGILIKICNLFINNEIIEQPFTLPPTPTTT